MRIPAVIIDCYKSHSLLHQSPGYQARLSERVAPVTIPYVIFLEGEIEDLAGLAEDEVVGLFLRLCERIKGSAGV